jgi:hypothetical protein
MTCPTVQIEDGNGGFIVVNECDFDSAKMKKFVEKKKRGPNKSKAETE